MLIDRIYPDPVLEGSAHIPDDPEVQAIRAKIPPRQGAWPLATAIILSCLGTVLAAAANHDVHM